MKMILVLAMVGVLAGCGTVGKTFPMPSTMKCLHHTEDMYQLALSLEKKFGYAIESPEKAYRRMRNECMWAKAAGKKD